MRTWRRWWLMGFACVGLLFACRSESPPKEGGSPSSTGQETLAFGRSAATNSAEVSIHLSMVVKAEVREKSDAAPRTSSVASSVENVTRYRVLETSGGGFKAEVTVVRDRESDGLDTATGPLEGHAFVVDTRSGARTVTEQGRTVSEAAREQVLEMIDGSLGEASDLGSVLGGRTVKVGQRLPELEAVLARMFQFGPSEGQQISGVRALLQAQAPNAKTASAEVELEFTLLEEPIRVVAPLRGTVTLDLASGALRKLEVRGPARVEPLPEAAAGGMSARGEGTISLGVEITTP